MLAACLFWANEVQTVRTKYIGRWPRKLMKRWKICKATCQTFIEPYFVIPSTFIPMHLIFICLYKVCAVCGLRQLQALEGGSQEAWSLRQIKLTNERPVSRSHDQYWPMRGQYWGHVTSIGQSEASDFWWRCIKLTRLQIKEFSVIQFILQFTKRQFWANSYKSIDSLTSAKKRSINGRLNRRSIKAHKIV